MKRPGNRPAAAPAMAGGGVAPRPSTGWNWWLGIFLLAAPLAAYWPALHGGFIWDDDDHISNNTTLQTLSGLWQIWFEPGATCQYYPLTFTAFWVEYHLWGLNPLGYHLVNVVMHGVVAVLLWQVLTRLRVRVAWLAAAIFALHPVCVMSVAWMTELKNTLSAALALGAVWAYLSYARKAESRTPINREREQKAEMGAGIPSSILHPLFSGHYWLALGLFVLAMFAKTAVSFLPVTLLLLVWWRRERIGWRDVWPLLPLVGIVAVMGQVTIYVERHSGGASGAIYSAGFLERMLVSGRSFWFYLGKLFFPYPLTFIYERWQVDAGVWWQYLYPAATVGLLAGLFLMRRRIGKGLFAAMMHFYVSTSLLILMVVLYMTKYSWVTDHWQYFGCMSVIAAAAAGISKALDFIAKEKPLLKPALTSLLLLLLGGLTWRQCGMYDDVETLWRETIARNPACSMAYNNLGSLFMSRGRDQEAYELFKKAVETDSANADAHYNLDITLGKMGRPGEMNTQYQVKAINQYQESLKLNPRDAEAHRRLADVLYVAGRFPEAIQQYQEALTLVPEAYTYNKLGVALGREGRLDEAISQFKEALSLRPDHPEARKNLDTAFRFKENQAKP